MTTRGARRGVLTRSSRIQATAAAVAYAVTAALVMLACSWGGQ